MHSIVSGLGLGLIPWKKEEKYSKDAGRRAEECQDGRKSSCMYGDGKLQLDARNA